MIKLFEMFSGCGGASWALKKANIPFRCVGISEIDNAAISCFNTNFPNIKNYGDCRTIDTKKLPEFELLTGGFPCQPFSEAGKHGGEIDTRGTLFYDIIRIADAKKPKFMLLENVKGLTFETHKKTFNKILSELDRIGYNVNYKVLNSKNHGVPQSRERVFFACFRKDTDANFTFPNEEPLKIFLKNIAEGGGTMKMVSVAIRNKNRAKHQAKGLPYGTFPIKYHLKYNSDIGVSYAIKSATHEFMVGNLDDVLAANARLEKNDHMTQRERFRYLMSMNIRRLSPRECFRLMGFLNDEINLEGLSDAQKYKIAGNGWDVNLVSKIFRQMFNAGNHLKWKSSTFGAKGKQDARWNPSYMSCIKEEVMKQLAKDFQKRLMVIFERERILSEGYCKSAEPSITISVSNDMKWYAEIYSYLTDYGSGGRHHSFEAETFEELCQKIDKAIKVNEK